MALAKYPHLLKVDVPVWERWLTLHKSKYALIEYDVRVGDGRDPGDQVSPNIRKMALDLSRRRIDAVAHTKSLITVIEITTQAGLKALGQIQAYPILYARTYPTTLPISPLLVCAEIDNDLAHAMRALKLPFHVV